MEFSLCSDGLRAGQPRFYSRHGKTFLFPTASRLVLGLTHPPIECVPEAISPGGKAAGV
jgi:hypothetical protein